MGELGVDTALESLGDGRYRAQLSEDWRIWGPNGGYIAAVLLRAAGEAASQPRPASLACHLLSVADFGATDCIVEQLRTSRNTEALRVTMRQGDRHIAEGLVWMVAEGLDGYEQQEDPAPDVAQWDQLASSEELRDEPSFYPFWDNVEWRPTQWSADWPPAEPSRPRSQSWMRFRPEADRSDPLIDAMRPLIMIDTMGWPAAHHGYAYDDRFIAPNIDLYVAFHQPAPSSAWLLIEAASEVAAGGLLATSGRVWDEHGALVASGRAQLLCRPVPKQPDITP